jgi:pheromone shutdown-related protein TraB
MTISNLKLLGTSHISKESVNLIKKTIQETKPEIVAIELDKNRLFSLLHKQTSINFRTIFQIGAVGFIFMLIGHYVQKKLGNVVNVQPGSDMLTAVKEAKKIKSKIALIDQDIRVTLKSFSKQITWKERFRFLGDIFNAIFRGKKMANDLGIKELDLSKVPSDKIIKKLIGLLKERYPSVHKTLIDDRNKHMVKNLKMLLAQNPEKNIVAVVGAGHLDGMEKELKKKNEPSYTWSYSS